jgi:pyruvate formate lyase activating enzyme
MCRWIKDNLGPDVPFFFTRFTPQYRLANLPPTPIETLEEARAVALEEGLHYVYTGNVPGHAAENTVCYNCGNRVIERVGYRTQAPGLDAGRCRRCGADLNIRG